MAADMMMLQKLSEEIQLSIAIRFYEWEGPWLSIGYHQKHIPQHWVNLVKEGKIKLVRRPSGGSAVLHSGGLTYCLAWKAALQIRNLSMKEIFQKNI